MRMEIMMMKNHHEAEDEDVARTFDQHQRQNHRKPRANHVTLRFFQQSCARDSEMLILGNSSLIILW